MVQVVILCDEFFTTVKKTDDYLLLFKLLAVLGGG